MADESEWSPHLPAARELLARHPIIDGHNDLPWEIRKHPAAPGDLDAYDLRSRAPEPGDTDLPRLRAGGVGGQFWSVYVPGEGGAGRAVLQLEQLDLARRMIARYPEALELCLGAADVDRALAAGRIASLLGMEGGHVLEGSLGALRAFWELGARYLTLTHNTSNDIGDSATGDPTHGGLSPFGRQVVAEMNRLGMLVDLSHVSVATMSDALDASRAPVIFSHSSAQALCDVPRNVPDQILRRLPANGGVVMVTFVAGFIGPEAAAVLMPAMIEFNRRAAGIKDVAVREALARELIDSLVVPSPPLEAVADHVEHVAALAGPDHVGIGGDYDGNTFWPVDLEDVSCYPNLVAELLRRGWSEENVAKLANGNIRRVLREAEAAAG
ncbi:MAG TPA: dipeptidase [Candidatus Limnocylindria bacterium]|nr:dipeptidase [Candidatus Limnocylindria bacterium]